MKKTLIALAAVAAATAASAQVTLSGNFAAVLQNTSENSGSVFKADDARLRFSASEDLGGGLKLSGTAMIEAGAGRGSNNVSGQDYTVSLSGAFGTLALQNYLADNTGLSHFVSAADDLNTALGAQSANTRVKYTLPEMVKGLGIAFKFNDGATAGTIDTLDGAGFDIDYSVSGVTVGVSGDTTDGVSEAFVEYDAGFAKFAVWGHEADGTEFTVKAPITPALTVGAHFINYETAQGYGLQAVYSLSKRTSVSLNYVDADEGAWTGNNYRVKLNHNF